MTKSVSAVVVTYNRLELLKEVIESIKSQTVPVSHLIVVDNASNHDTKDYLESLGNSIDYLRLEENLGGAGGFNHGIRYFMEETKDDFVWVMDDDTVTHPDTLEQLLSYADDQPNFSFLASDVRWIDGHRSKMNLPSAVEKQPGDGEVPEDQVEPLELKNASFVSLMIKREIIEKIGLPITDFFIWGDDIEYTERAARVAPGYFVPASKVTHKMASNVGSSLMDDGPNRTPRYFYSYRNRYYYVNQREFLPRLKGMVKLHLELWQMRFAKTERKDEKLAVLKKGLKAGRSFRPDVEFAKNNKDI
ncbi:glycosyltransferase family 2 protein [Fructobacillus durionis]|uniref:Glycosyltransferase, GT2 family n=1 Tax=Fructobacillus durionis TaxID=283737 RepID=A0A1I1E4C0_9LACO|nr:glycosyltransferase family 2 protein [Fructobacillus durionis]SFB81502.1 Glycosyltransferase, GT2 family [Fructobacillus durionis]